MANITEISTILANLGFDLDADDEAFVEDVARLVNVGDIEGLINRIAGGATYGESRALAERIIDAAGASPASGPDLRPVVSIGGNAVEDTAALYDDDGANPARERADQ